MFIDGSLLRLDSSKIEKKDFYIFIFDIKDSKKLIQYWGETKFFNFYIKIFSEIFNYISVLSQYYQTKFFIKNLGDGLIILIYSSPNKALENNLVEFCQTLTTKYPLKGLISWETLTCFDFSNQNIFIECWGRTLNKMFFNLKTIETCKVLINS